MRLRVWAKSFKPGRHQVAGLGQALDNVGKRRKLRVPRIDRRQHLSHPPLGIPSRALSSLNDVTPQLADIMTIQKRLIDHRLDQLTPRINSHLHTAPSSLGLHTKCSLLLLHRRKINQLTPQTSQHLTKPITSPTNTQPLTHLTPPTTHH